jgi:hypothetical protein
MQNAFFYQEFKMNAERCGFLLCRFSKLNNEAGISASRQDERSRKKVARKLTTFGSCFGKDYQSFQSLPRWGASDGLSGLAGSSKISGSDVTITSHERTRLKRILGLQYFFI